MVNTNKTNTKRKKGKKWKIKFAPGFQKSFDKCFSMNPIYSIPRFFSNIKSQIKWAWQRVFRGYDDRWYWSLDGHLNWIIPICVRKMKKGMGCPSSLYNKKNKRDECKEWHKILEKIAQGFEANEKIFSKYLWKGKRFEKLDKKYKDGMKLFVKYFDNLWD